MKKLTLIPILTGTIMVLTACISPAPVPVEPQAAAQPDFTIPTAREAYIPAIDLARQNDVRAELVSAAGAWTPLFLVEQIASGRTGWTFHFYLPGEQEMISIVVGKEGIAQITKRVPWVIPVLALDDQGWFIDSPEIAETLVENCGDLKDGATNLKVEARLSLAASEGRMIWLIRVTSLDEVELFCELSMDATTGQLR
jgi:hypothetical protein